MYKYMYNVNYNLTMLIILITLNNTCMTVYLSIRIHPAVQTFRPGFGELGLLADFRGRRPRCSVFHVVICRHPAYIIVLMQLGRGEGDVWESVEAYTKISWHPSVSKPIYIFVLFKMFSWKTRAKYLHIRTDSNGYFKYSTGF